MRAEPSEDSAVKGEDDEETGKILLPDTDRPPRVGSDPGIEMEDGPTRVGAGAYEVLARHMAFETGAVAAPTTAAAPAPSLPVLTLPQTSSAATPPTRPMSPGDWA